MGRRVDDSNDRIWVLPRLFVHVLHLRDLDDVHADAAHLEELVAVAAMRVDSAGDIGKLAMIGVFQLATAPVADQRFNRRQDPFA